MKKIYIIAAVLCSLALASCDSFLDVEPTNSSNAATAIKSPEDAQAGLNGIMRKMTAASYYGRNFVMYGDTKGGDMTIVSQGRGLDALYVFNHSATSNNYSGFWTQGYNIILQINTLLENIAKLEDDGVAGDFSLYKGQALTTRALIYFDLVRLYGKAYNYDKASYGVPKVTTVLEYNAQPTRASVEEIYNLILQDLTEGAALLKGKKVSNGYPGYYANKALEARVRLFMENYDGALAAAEEVIRDGGYTLYSNSEWVGSWASQFGKESIFELAIYDNEGDQGTGSIGAYQCRAHDLTTSAMGYFVASEYFLDRLGEDEDDVRWGIMSYDEISTERFGSCYKYLGSVSKSGDGKSTSTAVNVKVFRLSEMYLIAAEAALNASSADKAKAAGYLQEIRKRAPNLEEATASNITMQMIMDEYSKEFYGEGLRFFNMIRWNQPIEFDDDTPGLTPPHRDKVIDRTFYKTILPISQDEMNANKAIRDQQNPGY